MSLLCKHRELNGSTIVRLMAKAQERESKPVIQEVKPEEPKPKTTLGNKFAGWFLAAVALFFLIHVLISFAKNV